MKQRFSKRTRLVSALLTLAMVFTFLPFSAFAEVQTYIPLYKFSDETFREYLEQFDTDDDTFLSTAEREAVKKIDVSNKNISNLYGIQFFPNLETLYCYDNQLTELDVSKNPKLRTLNCSNNYLTSLDLRYNTELTKLSCYGNNLTSLDVRKNPALEQLSCRNNQLTSLDVSKNTKLTVLDCARNQLTSLDVSKNEKLEELYYDYNQLTSLQADNCTNLHIIGDLNNEYSVQVYESTRVLDPGTLPGNFDISRVRNLTGADKNADGTLTVNPGVGKVTYEYRFLNNHYVPFTLNVEVIPDGSIGINASNFPDPVFLEYVKRFDKDNNGALDTAEREAVTEIDVSNKNITTLEGISYFPNLFYLDCKKNQLTELDVSKNPALWGLECDENQLTSLDVSQNAELVYLYCNSNNLTSLDVSQTAVTTLYTSGNQIDINVEKTPRTFDLSTLPGFNASKASGWVGGDVDGNTLKVKPGVTQVTYTYDCGKGLSETFTLNVNVVPDGSTGGGTTPGGSTGGGSTGGGSTGGSTGGGSTGGGSTISPEAGKYQLTVTDGFATVNGSKGAVLNVEPGATVTLTADTTKFPDIDEFGWWEISPYGSVSDTLTGQYQRTATFTMPPENVTARAMSKTAGVSTGGDGGGDGAAILLVGGAAAAGLVGYGVYSYVSEQQLKALLPEGVAMPENRAQTALLLWNTAGRPEPAEAPAFKDVADPDTAKAAQWCVEHGLMNLKFRGRFAPDGSSPAYKTLNAYRQLVG